VGRRDSAAPQTQKSPSFRRGHRWAGLFPFRNSASSCSRSSPLNRTAYFFTEISLRPTPAVARIFDGEKDAKLIALACSKPPKGRARWTLRLLENKAVELRIVERASDSTIGRALKKYSPAPSPPVLGHPAQGQHCFLHANAQHSSATSDDGLRIKRPPNSG